MTAFLASILARFAATKLGKLLPSWAWEIVIIALLIGAGALAHHVAVVHRDNQVRAEQKAVDDKATEAQLAKLRAALTQKDAQLAAMSSQLRKANDEEHNRIAADAGSLLVRGPGKAACPRVSSAPAPSGGPIAPAPVASNAGPSLPPADGADVSEAAVPWPWLVSRGREHDDLLANEKKWHEWYDNLVKAWPKAK